MIKIIISFIHFSTFESLVGVWACSFNAQNDSVLCTASEDTSLRIWDLRTDNNWHSDALLSGVHDDAIKCLDWSPCGKYLAAGSADSKVP